ncbi:MAG: hypothetical protein QOH57_1733 [Mycobacterium sp.]|jgi:hypothetical protein|nr:hypothetical protein [Mycobacterium sp.]
MSLTPRLCGYQISMGEVTQTPAGTNKTAIAAFVAALAAGVALAVVLIAIAVTHGAADQDQLKIVTSAAFWLVPVCAVVGIVLGHVARTQTKRSGGSGRGLALWSLVIGYLALLAFIGFIALTVFVVHAFMHVA